MRADSLRTRIRSVLAYEREFDERALDVTTAMRVRSLLVLIAFCAVPIFAMKACGNYVSSAGPVFDPDTSEYMTTFEPGRWESKDGRHFLSLNVDGTASTNIVLNPGSYRDNSQYGTVAYAFVPYEGGRGSGIYGAKYDTDGHIVGFTNLAFREGIIVVMVSDENSESASFFTSGGDFFTDVHDWRVLRYSIGDPDIININLFRVDEGV